MSENPDLIPAADATPTDLGAPKTGPIAPAPDDKTPVAAAPVAAIAKPFPPGTVHSVVAGKPRISWPDVFVYRWTPEGGSICDTGLPPPNFPVAKLMKSGLTALRPSAEVFVFNSAAHDYLRQESWLQDDRHTGRNDGQIIDHQKAPK